MSRLEGTECASAAVAAVEASAAEGAGEAACVIWKPKRVARCTPIG